MNGGNGFKTKIPFAVSQKVQESERHRFRNIDKYFHLGMERQSHESREYVIPFQNIPHTNLALESRGYETEVEDTAES
jgi:hypothetical protein